MTMTIDSSYWQLASSGRDVCLNCPLRACVHEAAANQNDICPLDGSRPIRPLRHSDRRNRKLLEIGKVLETIKGLPTISEISRRIDVRRQTVDSWRHKGYIECEICTPPGGKRQLVLVKGINL
jgi:hypothetical protein